MSSDPSPVKVIVYVRDEEMGTQGENLWVYPLAANSGGGTYRVSNVGLFAPLAPDDVVRAELNATSRLQVTKVESTADRCVVHFVFDEDDAPPAPHQATDLAEISAAFARALEVHGVQVEGPPGFLVTAWPHGWGPDRFQPVAEEAMAAHPGWLPEMWFTPEERAEELAVMIDGSLVTDEPSSEAPQISYWAADDPGWSEVGVTDPADLAALQTLALGDWRVMATIEAGRHADVVTYLHRLREPNLNDLPPLDRPLLVGDGDGAVPDEWL